MKGIWRFLWLLLGRTKKRGEALAKLLYPDDYLQACNRSDLNKHMKLQMDKDPPRHTIQKQLYAILKHDTRKRLPALGLHTLIVKPELDILVRPTHSDELKSRIANSSMLSLADSGHGLIFQCAQEINQRLLQHFRGPESASPRQDNSDPWVAN